MRGLAKEIASLLVWLAALGPVWAGFDEGVAAYTRGDYATALREFRVAAAQGDSAAQFNLGMMNALGQGVLKDDRQAVIWYRKAAEQGDAAAQLQLGLMYAFGEGVAKDAQQAAFWIRKAAEQGNVDAQYDLAKRYADGVGVPKDDPQALFWYRKSAEQGSVKAQAQLGGMYNSGVGVAKDHQQALFWARKAADQGDAGSQVYLGATYAFGVGTPRDEPQGLFWFRKAAEQGDAVAQYFLGSMYRDGRGVPKDDQQAVIWYRKAADQGDARSQYSLGLRYALGQGVPKDDEQSVFWYRKAADQGNAKAQYFLGFMYATGRGVPKDDQQAVIWYRKAAEQGDAYGQSSLGRTYAAGRGVPKDDQQAYFWSLLAAAQGDSEAAKRRDSIERDLTPQQRADAQAAARDWKPKTVVATNPSVGRSPGATLTYEPAEREVPDSTGSGFLVAGGRVVTNYHVTEGCTRLRLDGQSDSRLLGSDPRNDLALISSAGRSPDTATIRIGKVRIGESVIVAGFPLSGLLSGLNITTGNVSSLAGMRGDTRMLQITAPVQPGNSGGPLLDGGGKVIGVVVSKLDALKVAEATGDVPQNINFAINANVLASFLDANGVDYKSGPIGASITTQEVARRAQAFTVLIECWK